MCNSFMEISTSMWCIFNLPFTRLGERFIFFIFDLPLDDFCASSAQARHIQFYYLLRFFARVVKRILKHGSILMLWWTTLLNVTTLRAHNLSTKVISETAVLERNPWGAVGFDTGADLYTPKNVMSASCNF